MFLKALFIIKILAQINIFKYIFRVGVMVSNEFGVMTTLLM